MLNDCDGLCSIGGLGSGKSKTCLASSGGAGQIVKRVLQPLVLKGALAQSNENAVNKSAIGPPRRLLVVEDEANIRDLVCLHLDSEGYACVPMADGSEALALLKLRPFDLIVLDLMLKGVDGLSICRTIRQEGPNQEVPVLMLTARREEPDKLAGFA